MNALLCPQCGSGDLDPVGRDRLRCKHCGVTSEQNQAKDALSILVWVCPKCGFDNEKQSEYCGKCGNSLTRECPKCGAAIRWDLNFCSKCQFEFMENERVITKWNESRLGGPFEGILTNYRIAIRTRPGYRQILLKDIVFVNEKRTKYVVTKFTVKTNSSEEILETSELSQNDLLKNTIRAARGDKFVTQMYYINGGPGVGGRVTSGCFVLSAYVFVVLALVIEVCMTI